MLCIEICPCSCLCVFYIQDLDRHLQSLTAQFERAAAEKLHCQEEVTHTRQTIELASRLVGGLQVLHERVGLGQHLATRHAFGVLIRTIVLARNRDAELGRKDCTMTKQLLNWPRGQWTLAKWR